MANQTLFTIDPKDLENQGPDRAIQIFRRLLWVESDRVGIGRNLNEVPANINVGDGGIDAFIENANPNKDELIPKGSSGFQVKSSDLQPASCRKELHIGNNLEKPLKPEIKKVLDSGGTYILVLFADISKIQKSNREEAIKDELNKLKQVNKFLLYTASTLSGFINKYPSLVSWINNYDLNCIPYDTWSKNSDIDTPKIYVADDIRTKFTEEIRDKLRNSDGKCPVLRITGLPGIGKTRFVHETLGTHDLREKVIYIKAEQFLSSPLLQELQIEESLSSIIVVDECSIRQHDELVRSFSSHSDRLSLITISYEMGNIPPPSLQYKLSKLSEDSINKIFKNTMGGLPPDVISRLSHFADGYPKIADLLAESYLTNKENNQEDLINVSDDNLMDRLIGGSDTTSDNFRDTKKVLQWISIFDKIGFSGDVSKESEWIISKIGMDFFNFQVIVSDQQERGIIQGQYYIYITPFMLRIHLLQKWWASHGFTIERFIDFVTSIPEGFRADLLKRFFEQIPYISSSNKGKIFIDSILGKDGLFSDGSFLRKELGSDFFLKLTEANPKTALDCLKNTIGNWSKEQLQEYKKGRRNIVWALEIIAVYEDLFDDAARLLLKLAEAENENYANNSSGIFVDLFSPGPGRVAPTQASLEIRFPILEESINSDSKDKRSLALDACEKALETSHFSRIVGPEYQGAKIIKLWEPKSPKEILDYYKKVWNLIYSKMDNFQQDEQKKAIKILLDSSRDLTYIKEMAEIIIPDINEVSSKEYADKKEIIKTVESILYHGKEELSDEIKKKWIELKDKLVGTDFSSLMERYVGMDVIEDRIGDKDSKNEVEKVISELAQKVIEDSDLLKQELPWLVTQEAKNGYMFGYNLCQFDEDLKFLPAILDAQKKISDKIEASDYFLGGYLRKINEKDTNHWEELLDDLAKDEDLANWIPGLTWRSGMSDRATLRILNLAKEGTIEPKQFRIFKYGSVIANISEKVFLQWMEYLVGKYDYYSASIVLDLLDFYYLRSKSKQKLPEELVYKLLTHPSLYKIPKSINRDQMDDYHWTKVGLEYVKLYPERSLNLASIIFKHFGQDGSILEGYSSQTHKVINYISQKNSEEVWKEIEKYIGPPIDKRAYHIKEWLRGEGLFKEGKGQLNIFSFDIVFKWVDENLDKRAWYLATFIPKDLFTAEKKFCWTRELLIRYGNREDIRRNLSANYSTEGFSGPSSIHYQEKKNRFVDLKKNEDNPNVLKWINGYIDGLDKEIERAKIEEERSF